MQCKWVRTAACAPSSNGSSGGGGGSGSSDGTHASAVAVTAVTAAEAEAQDMTDDLPVVDIPDLHPNPAPVPSGHAEPLMTSVPSFSSVIELGDLMAAAELAAEPAVARKAKGAEVPAVPLPCS